jgi:hypothetical protein
MYNQTSYFTYKCVLRLPSRTYTHILTWNKHTLIQETHISLTQSQVRYEQRNIVGMWISYQWNHFGLHLNPLPRSSETNGDMRHQWNPFSIDTVPLLRSSESNSERGERQGINGIPSTLIPIQSVTEIK